MYIYPAGITYNACEVFAFHCLLIGCCMCGVTVTDKFTCSQLRERLGIEDVIGVTAKLVEATLACARKYRID